MLEINRKKYKRITYEDRKIIESMIQEGKPRLDIAFVIGIHTSTLDRELKRGGYPDYTADKAQKKLT